MRAPFRLSEEGIREALKTPMGVIEHLLTVEDGRTYGECMTEWQRKDFEAILATEPDGSPTHRLCYIAVSYTHLTLPTICSV